MVSFNLVTDSSIAENEIKKILDDDTTLTNREMDHKMLWRIESPLDEQESILIHIRKIISNMSIAKMKEIEKAILEIYFDIGVMYDTFTCSTLLTSECIDTIHKFNEKAGVNITCYPTNESDTTEHC